MKTCAIFGDLSSDRASGNYPTVQICDECLAADEKRQEGRKFVTADKYDPSFLVTLVSSAEKPMRKSYRRNEPISISAELSRVARIIYPGAENERICNGSERWYLLQRPVAVEIADYS